MFKVGEIVYYPARDEELEILEIDDNGRYYARLTRLDTKVAFTYGEYDLEANRPRRYSVTGDHHMKLCDFSNDSDGEFIGKGTWGIKDNYNDTILCWITSGGSRAIAIEMVHKLNAGDLLNNW